jgi:hypothetical protein
VTNPEPNSLDDIYGPADEALDAESLPILLASFVCHKCIVYLSQILGDIPGGSVIPVGNIRSCHPGAFTAL